jgi:hypothetical protein
MTFYAYNTTLRGTTQREAAAALEALGEQAYVSPTIDGITVLSSEASEDDKHIRKLGQTLSAELNCVALVLHDWDDAILWYQLYENGEAVDEYESCPDYFDFSFKKPRGPIGGDARKLCAAFHAPMPPEFIEAILRPDAIMGSTESVEALRQFAEYLPDEPKKSVLREMADENAERMQRNEQGPLVALLSTMDDASAERFRKSFAAACQEGGSGAEAAETAIQQGFDSERVRHAALVAALGLPTFAVVYSYGDIQDVWSENDLEGHLLTGNQNEDI